MFIYISAAEIGVYDRDTQGPPRVWNREPNDNASNQCPGGCRACEATARKVSKYLGVSPADYSFPRTRTIQHSCPTARPLPPAPAPAAAAPLIPPSDAAVGPRATAPALGDDEVSPQSVRKRKRKKKTKFPSVGQPSPRKPRLVVSHSTCPPVSSSPTRTAL